MPSRSWMRRYHHSIRIRVQLLRRGIVSSDYLCTLTWGSDSHCRTSTVLSPTHGQGKYICTVSLCRSKGHADSSQGSPCLSGVTLEGTSVRRNEQITFQRVKLPQKVPHSEPRGPWGSVSCPLYLVCLVKVKVMLWKAFFITPTFYIKKREIKLTFRQDLLKNGSCLLLHYHL